MTVDEPSPEAREAAREWVDAWMHGGDGCKICEAKRRHGAQLLRSLFDQPPGVQAAIRDELGGGA